jgi:hypothetical protein
MQKTKDTFLNHLMTRLAELDSTRTVTIDGVTRPAVVACENERAELAGTFENTFSIEWMEVAGDRNSAGVQSMECLISYWTNGDSEKSGVDRGRGIGAMDDLLRSMLADKKTVKLDLTASPAVELGSFVFWGGPKFGTVEQKGMRLQRTAKVNVHYFPENRP